MAIPGSFSWCKANRLKTHAVQTPVTVHQALPFWSLKDIDIHSTPKANCDCLASRPSIQDVKTAAAAAVLLTFLSPPGSVILPLLEVVVLEDDEEVLHLAADSMSKCSLVSS